MRKPDPSRGYDMTTSTDYEGHLSAWVERARAQVNVAVAHLKKEIEADVLKSTAKPAKHFANPPYKAALLDERKLKPKDEYKRSNWAGVMNAQGVNCLTFTDKPGAAVTSMAEAERIAAEWNGG